MQDSPLNNQVQSLLSTKIFDSGADGVDQRPAKRARQEQPAVVEQQEPQQQAVAIDLTSGANDAVSGKSSNQCIVTVLHVAPNIIP